MTADVLRAAAKLMRERAEAVTFPGPWGASTSEVRNRGVSALGGQELVADCGWNDAQHIASWHPLVALAVADWLEGVAETHHLDRDAGECPNCGSAPCGAEPALKVALAYLGES